MNNKYHWLMFLLLIINSILDNNLSNILFTEPINQSYHKVLQQQENFQQEKLKGAQPKNDWENKELVLC